MRMDPQTTSAELEPEEAYLRLVDPAWYLNFYGDLAGTDVDACEHFRNHGAREGRNPNRYFKSAWYLETYLHKRPADIDALEYFILEGANLGHRPHPLLDLEFIRVEHGLRSNLEAFLLLITDLSAVEQSSKWFSRTFYRQHNPDVSSIPDCEDHFLTYGGRENRLPSEEYQVVDRATADRLGIRRSEIIDEYSWDQIDYFVIKARVSKAITAQILRQGELDPSIYAPGVACLPYLPRFISDNLKHRDLVDHKALLSEFDNCPEAVVVVGRLGLGGAEKYAGNLAEVLSSKLGLRVSVITTDSSDDDNRNAKNLKNLRGFRSVRVVSFADYARANTWKRETVLALLLMSIQPKYLFLVNSDLGLRMIEKHGAALGNVCQVFTSMFSQSPFAVGAPYSAVYLKQVVRHLSVFSDNEAALRTISQAVPPSFSDKFICVPQQVELPSKADFSRAVEVRLHRNRKSSTPIRCLWVSRWEQFKATDVLRVLAENNSNLLIDCFGPGQAEDPAPRSPNLRNLGIAWDVGSIDTTDYDVFLFTSRFEGMPNVVLEMAGRAIPIVASDVGGLKETFQSGSISLVDMQGPPTTVAARFAIAISKAAALRGGELGSALQANYDALMARHSASAFVFNVRSQLLGMSEATQKRVDAKRRAQ